MKTVRDVCATQPNTLSVNLSDQIEQLDQRIGSKGDGGAFFDKTLITQGMHDLAAEGIARLASASSHAVFHLKQAMGGGKTHLLVRFGLLADRSAADCGCAEIGGCSELHQSALRATLNLLMALRKGVDGAEVLAHLTVNVPNDHGNVTQRELVKNQRLGWRAMKGAPPCR